MVAGSGAFAWDWKSKDPVCGTVIMKVAEASSGRVTYKPRLTETVFTSGF
jgi:hypothetical protein